MSFFKDRWRTPPPPELYSRTISYPLVNPLFKQLSTSLAVVPPSKAPLLAPPKTLTARQKELWEQIALSRPASWFDRSTAPLLAGYVNAIASHEILAARSDAIEATLEDSDPEDAKQDPRND